MIRLIVAIDERRGLADESGIPWQGKLPTDTRYFRDQVAGGLTLAGYRTYEELAAPLNPEGNFVLTRPNSPLRAGFEPVTDLERFFDDRSDATVWVIGGAGLFDLSLGRADQLFITQLQGDFHCTKFFPEFEDSFSRQEHRRPITENGISFSFDIWLRTTSTSRDA